MRTRHELTAADGTLEEPLPESPVLTARDDGGGRQVTLEAKRPALRVRSWVWKDRERNQTPGVGLWSGDGKLKAHLTPDEARAMADTLHDFADRIGGASS